MNSSDSETSSTSRSVSRSPSPALSLEEDSRPPTLEKLVLHFVSAKRSLSSTSHVYRANELVTHSRSLIEEIAILNAKTTFAHRALTSQIETLSSIQDTTITEGDQISQNFDDKVLALDAAHERLGKTLDSLRGTIVEASQTSEEEEEKQKTLYDFIDDATHENLLSLIRKGIDTYHATRSQNFEIPLQDLDQRLKSLTTALTASSEEDSSPRLKPAPNTLPTLFQTLTTHAQSLANSLSQLVKHYDLCVTALKHTEGGGEAARLAVDAVEDDSLYANRFEPMDDEEREAMLGVLVDDAEEVEDVISEMGELGSGMEGAYDEILGRAESARREQRELRGVLKSLAILRTSFLPGTLQSATNFCRSFYPSLAQELEVQTSELLELVRFYEEFQRGYGALLREVERRREVGARARAVAEKAQRELDRIWEGDCEARERFVEDFGGVLPRDLGRAFGLGEEGVRWVVGEEG